MENKILENHVSEGGQDQLPPRSSLTQDERAALATMPFELWTECTTGQICMDLAKRGFCKHTRRNSTLGYFEITKAGRNATGLRFRMERRK